MWSLREITRSVSIIPFICQHKIHIFSFMAGKRGKYCPNERNEQQQFRDKTWNIWILNDTKRNESKQLLNYAFF